MAKKKKVNKLTVSECMDAITGMEDHSQNKRYLDIKKQLELLGLTPKGHAEIAQYTRNK